MTKKTLNDILNDPYSEKTLQNLISMELPVKKLDRMGLVVAITKLQKVIALGEYIKDALEMQIKLAQLELELRNTNENGEDEK